MGVYGMVRAAANVAAFPAYTHFFLSRGVGAAHGVTLRDKLRLLRRVRRNARRIPSATGWLEQLVLVSQVLSLPRELEGDVVECGCFKGASTASLSLACELVGRRLIVCDSFQGLPPVDADDAVHITQSQRRYEVYEQGQYAGSLEEVRGNVTRYGAIDRCEFVPGYFEDTLDQVRGPLAMIFLDVDLNRSLRTCVTQLWPRLSDYGYLYTHEAQQLDYVALFFDRDFWHETLGCDPPGLIGAGTGVPVGVARGCGLGYTIKIPPGVTADQRPDLVRFCGDPTQPGESDPPVPAGTSEPHKAQA